MTTRESRRGERYYRYITACVLQRYYELEDGVVGPERGLGAGGPTFDPRVLDYRIDVERVLLQLTTAQQAVLAGVHRDGLSCADAVRSAGVVRTVRADDLVLRIEIDLGKKFERAKLMDIEGYIA
jgi:hypothetical protein